MNSRIKSIRTGLLREGLDGFFLSSNANISYLSGHLSRDSYLLISGKSAIYITDARYTQEAKSRIPKSITLKEVNGPCYTALADICVKLDIKRLAFEEDSLTFGQYQDMKKRLSGKGIELVPAAALVEGLREIKSRDEIDKIRQAGLIIIKALRFIKPFLRAGAREIEVAGELESFIRYNGARTSAFEIIVASGPNSAFCHHITCERKLKNNEPLYIDIGVDYQGYKSDLTRAFFLGKINPLARRIYNIVLQAQAEALKRIKPGVKIEEIDNLARSYIAKKGFGGFFRHSLGHGIGLEVHEAPRICAKTQEILKPGMVFTVEPAIYLPGKFGIRIEDMVLVTKKGCEVISGSLDK